MWKPVQLGREQLPDAVLSSDRKNCRKYGPCGVGEQALYLNSFYIDRRYYVPFSSVTRVFKRVAMSKGGFSGKGVFATIPYLVVVYDDGKEKQCNFKYEEQVDQLLQYLAKARPELKRISRAAEQRLAEKEQARAMQKMPALSDMAKTTISELKQAADYLDKRPELSLELSQSARRKRAYLQSKPSYKWAALAITLLGLCSLLYGIYSFVHRTEFAIYFTLFGIAAIFLFSGVSMLPTSKNNRHYIMNRVQKAQAAVEQYIQAYDSVFPLPARYAHTMVLKRMVNAVEESRAVTTEEALDVVKTDLKALNSSVKVDQEEYEEVVAIKALFLNEDYR
ncbi:MAG: ATPase P [Oscillospiraceae bacterium]|jgi:hypothetical protein